MSAASHARSGDLLQRARRAAGAGDHVRATQLYGALLAAQPTHAEALSYLGLQAFERGDLAASLAFADRAVAGAPGDPVALRNRAAVRAAAGALADAEADLVLAMNQGPMSCLTALQLGALRDRRGDARGALAAWRTAFRLEPRLQTRNAASGLPAPLPELAAQARERTRAWLEQRQAAALTAARAAFPGAALQRVERALDMHAGRTPLHGAAPQQQPQFLLVPDLPAQPYLERGATPWLGVLEAAASVIRTECLAVLTDRDGFAPYIAQQPTGDIDWSALIADPRWSSFHFFKGGQRIAANCARCPGTVAALEATPIARLHGVPTEAFLSVLAPGTHIPPHHGITNAKSVVHLGLVIPPDCSLRVAGVARSWHEGEAFLFDDSFEHEARNDSSTPRVVLILEVWNPNLTPAEMLALQGVFEAFEEVVTA